MGDMTGTGLRADDAGEVVLSQAETGKDDDVAKSTDVVAVMGSSSADVSLESLAPYYDESQHKTYLDRLIAAVEDDKNRNIALTGRYGSGKSSVLNEFVATHPRTRRLAISTLAPDTDDQGKVSPKTNTKTNRIQKELVKQLIYSAVPNTLRHSRFSRISALPWGRTYWHSAAGVAVLGVLLYLLGWLPPALGTGGGQPWYQQFGIWVAIGALLSGVVVVARQQLHDRFFVSDVSAAGTALKLSPRTPTYFDEYLEEIVNYFDEEEVDTVILEDLDRFDDPHIFEALRELNTLLNNTPKRKAKETPLRFVYAVRDSLFEKLGSDFAGDDDAATAETERANRTKFFDLVIPMVPFISHRNAQDLLAGLLKDANIDGVDRSLVDLVGRHATDMRLLRNMRNELLVFSERLLEQKRRAPGLTPGGLFALVAYKNFHLGDFEQISRRCSDLDTLYDYRRVLVRTCVAEFERQKRELLAGRGRVKSMEAAAARLGDRLHRMARFVRKNSSWPNWDHFLYQVGGTDFRQDQVTTYEFWVAAAKAEEVNVLIASSPGAGATPLVTFADDDLAALFHEMTEAGRWYDIDEDKTRDSIAQLDRDIAFLRGAEFNALAGRDSFTFTTNVTNDDDGAEQVERTFAEFVGDTMKSDLATDLVKRGYIDRNFSLYAAQFYGEFTGVDVATFMVQCVQPNMMEVDYQFTSTGAVKNLLDAAGDDFTHTSAAHNLEVVDYLLEQRDTRIDNVIASITGQFDVDTNAQEFLTAYLSSGRQRQTLAARLSSQGWGQVFTYLIGDDVPDDVRTSLVDAALLAVNPKAEYAIDDFVTKFFAERYQDMTAFTERQGPGHTTKIVSFLKKAGVRVPKLGVVAATLKTYLVHDNLYELTAANLRSALDVTGNVSLDRVRQYKSVYERCLQNPATYLAAIADDNATKYTIIEAETLAAVLTDIEGNWDADRVTELVDRSGPKSTLATLTNVPTSTWPALAAADRFDANFANVEAYRSEVGFIDKNLANLLVGGRTIEIENASDDRDRTALAVALLNASDVIEPAATRVDLARSLGVNEVSVDQINPEAGDLLALLITHALVPDDPNSFARFQPHGWAAIGPAIAASGQFENFMTGGLLTGMVAELLTDEGTQDRLGQRVVENLAEYIPGDDLPLLKAAAEFAIDHNLALPTEQVRRIAILSVPEPDLTMRLLASPAQDPTPDDIVQAFAELGAPYDNFITRAEGQFDVADDESHRMVFKKLENADRCNIDRKRRKTPVIEVELK